MSVKLNPRIKISPTGRPYVEIRDVVKSELDRIDRADLWGEGTKSNSATVNDTGSTNINGDPEKDHPKE